MPIPDPIFELYCRFAEIRPDGNDQVKVSMLDVNRGEIDVDDFIDLVGEEAILDSIGQQTCAEHFGWKGP